MSCPFSTRRVEPVGPRRWLAVLPIACCLLTGCASGGFTPPWRSSEPTKDSASDGIIQTGAYYTKFTIDPEMQKRLNAAKAVFAQGNYKEAEPMFHKIVEESEPLSWFSTINPFAAKEPDPDDIKNKDDSSSTLAEAKKKAKRRGPNPIAEEALFYQAECWRLMKNYREAEWRYTQLLTEYPRSQFDAKVCQGLFEIADHWLEPTRQELNEFQEQMDGKRWFVFPWVYFQMHWDKDMPLMDTEGHAVQVLNTIRLHDIKGPLGEKSLLYLGTIHFYRKEFKDADFYFSQLYQEFPNSPHAAKAVKQAVICKQLQTGGPIYDCRGVEESKKLLQTGMGAYPELARDETWVNNQLMSIGIQMAEKDMKIAEYYERTGHPGAAYFQYELVIRRFPNTSFSDKASKRKEALQQHAPATTPPRPEPAASSSTPTADQNQSIPRNLPQLSPPTK